LGASAALALFVALTFDAAVEAQAHTRPAQASVYGATAAFRWHDESGREVELSHFRDERVYLTLFYTTCRSHVCSVAIDSMREIEQQQREQGESSQFVLITLDPERDTPATLARYKRGYEMGDNWHLLVGDRRQTDELARMLHYSFYKKDFHYVHTYAIYELDPRGVIVDVIGWDSKAGHGPPT